MQNVFVWVNKARTVDGKVLSRHLQAHAQETIRGAMREASSLAIWMGLTANGALILLVQARSH